MTVVLVGTLEVPRIAELAASLRGRGVKVLALDSMSLVALVMLTERVGALVVHEDQAPADWTTARERLAQICPTAAILFVASGDPRTVEQLARDSVTALDGSRGMRE